MSVGWDGRSMSGEEGDEQVAHQVSWKRRILYAAVRAVVVLLIGAVVYPLVIPYNHAVRSRLALMVPKKSGLAAYDKAKPQAGPQADNATGLAAVTSAAAKSPGGTGIYSIEWSPNQTSGAGVIAFLLPDSKTATTALAQIKTQQLAPGSYTSDQLKRVSTFTLTAVPASAGSVYHPTATKGGPPGLAVVAFRYGRVVAVAEVANSDTAAVQADTEKLAATEVANLHAIGSGFTLEETVNPVLATSVWGAGAVVLALLVALVPLERHRRALKRQRAYEAEMANKVVVGRQVIAKRRQ